MPPELMASSVREQRSSEPARRRSATSDVASSLEVRGLRELGRRAETTPLRVEAGEERLGPVGEGTVARSRFALRVGPSPPSPGRHELAPTYVTGLVAG